MLAVPVVTIIPVLLPSPNSGAFVGSVATAVGWGRTNPNSIMS